MRLEIERAEIIYVLTHTLSNLQLTGSHWFGGVTDKSDMDFFTSDAADLTTLGFELVSIRGYADSVTIAVWRNMGLKIDVQVVNSFDLKLKAQKILSLRGTLPTDKAERTDLWNAALALAASI